jgi:hypothetical protein
VCAAVFLWEKRGIYVVGRSLVMWGPWDVEHPQIIDWEAKVSTDDTPDKVDKVSLYCAGS